MTGHCLAGGLELALMCDLIYACESAKFGTTEINMGILPGWGGTVRIARSMPIYRAREIIYSGRKDYPAREMYEMGFLTRVFKDEEFETKFNEVVANISSKKLIALRMAKEVMGRSLECGSLDAALAMERNAIQWLIYAPDIQAVMDRSGKSLRSWLISRRRPTSHRIEKSKGETMDFGLTEEQHMIQETFQKFCEKELTYEYVRWMDENVDFPPDELWQKFVDMGICGPVPAEYGGQGLGYVDACSRMNRSAKDRCPWPWPSASPAGFGVRFISELGTKEQKEKYLPLIGEGKYKTCMALTEPAGGTDILGALSTFAEEKSDRFVINGQKVFITGAHVADGLMTICKTEKDAKKSNHGPPSSCRANQKG